jgi:dihydroxyacetone kinase
MTALEMAGVSITVLKVNDDFLQMLDHPTTAPAWPRVFSGGFWFSHTADHIITPPECNEEISSKSSAASLSSLAHLDEHGELLVVKAIQQICKVLMDNEAILNTLDSESGDGDCGNTHSRFAKAVLDSQHLTFRCPANLLHQLSIVAQEAMGGLHGRMARGGHVATGQGLPKLSLGPVMP